MFRLPVPLKSLGTAAASSISQPLLIVSALAETGAAHAEAYRDNQLESIELNKVERRKVSALEARRNTARRIKSLQDELNADDDLAEIFESLGAKDFDVEALLSARNSPNLRVAAE